MKTGLLFKLACLLIAAMVLLAHLLRKNGPKARSRRRIAMA